MVLYGSVCRAVFNPVENFARAICLFGTAKFLIFCLLTACGCGSVRSVFVPPTGRANGRAFDPTLLDKQISMSLCNSA